MNRRDRGELIADLRKWGALKVGDEFPVNDWGPALSKLLNDAADTIEEQMENPPLDPG